MSREGYIPQEKIDEVRLAADVVEVVGRRVRLTKKGKDWWGLCPFHGDSDPSLKVDRGRGTWYCFGCSEGGSVFNFVMKDEGLSFPEAVKELARRYGVELPRPRLSPEARRAEQRRQLLLQVLETAGKFFSQQLQSAAGRAARQYLFEQRGLAPETVRQFALGFAPDSWEGLRGHLLGRGVSEDLAVEAGLLIKRERGSGSYDRFRGRVMLPIRGGGGSILSFGGRILGPGEPKYMNGPESPVFHKSRTLYNLDQARQPMRRKDRALVVEGYFDVITLAAAGFGETVAPLGTALTQWQVRRLKGQASEVILIFDGDQAGLRAAFKALPLFLEEGVPARVLLLPQGEDPDSFLQKRGAPALEEALAGARPLVEEALDRVLADSDLTSPEGRSRAVGRAGEIIRGIKDPVVRSQYLDRLAKQLELSTESVAQRLGLPLERGRAVSLVSAPPPASGDRQERGLLEFALSSPQAARALLENGALASLADPRLAQVGRAIADVLERGADPTPAAVCQALEDQSLASLVNQLCQCRLELPPEQARHHAEDYLRQLQEKRRRRERRQLLKEMRAAQEAGDRELLARLQARHRQLMNRNHPSPAEKD